MSVFHVETEADGTVNVGFKISPGRHSEKDIDRARKILALINCDEETEAPADGGLDGGKPGETQEYRQRVIAPDGGLDGGEPVRDGGLKERQWAGGEDSPARTASDDGDTPGDTLRQHTPADRMKAKPPAILARCQGVNGMEHVLCHSKKTSKVFSSCTGGHFGIYDVDTEGYILPRRNLPEDRKMGCSREKAIARFNAWAEANVCSLVKIFDEFDGEAAAAKKEGE
jgi:hypothetical protein